MCHRDERRWLQGRVRLQDSGNGSTLAVCGMCWHTSLHDLPATDYQPVPSPNASGVPPLGLCSPKPRPEPPLDRRSGPRLESSRPPPPGNLCMPPMSPSPPKGADAVAFAGLHRCKVLCQARLLHPPACQCRHTSSCTLAACMCSPALLHACNAA